MDLSYNTPLTRVAEELAALRASVDALSERIANLEKTPPLFSPDSETQRERKEERSKEEKKEKRKSTKTLPVEATMLAKVLNDYVVKNSFAASMGYSVRGSDLDRSAADIDKLHRLDGAPWALIDAVIKWSQNDSFWKSNILSGGSLRKHFSQLVAKMGAKVAVPTATDVRFD